MLTRSKSCKSKDISSAQSSAVVATAPKVTKKRPVNKPPAMPIFGKSSEKDIIESTARKAAENHMHLNIHKFTPTINQAVKIAVRQALDEAIPKIVEQAVKNIEAKQVASQVGTSVSSMSNSVVYRTVTTGEAQTVMSAVPAVIWRQCPNGHRYAVGECGRPAQVGLCIECKARLF
ncbi:hypothetical protein GGI20_001499 [Coemansia sp. BCRC 34301]|nr:hypothetical protein GGI20_001499 [Coemansia sp. BCRC 34301]